MLTLINPGISINQIHAGLPVVCIQVATTAAIEIQTLAYANQTILLTPLVSSVCEQHIVALLADVNASPYRPIKTRRKAVFRLQLFHFKVVTGFIYIAYIADSFKHF